MLWDTDAKHFILDSVAFFKVITNSGFILMKGMELGVVKVPQHVLTNASELVWGVISVGIWPPVVVSKCGNWEMSDCVMDNISFCWQTPTYAQ